MERALRVWALEGAVGDRGCWGQWREPQVIAGVISDLRVHTAGAGHRAALKLHRIV